MSEEMLSEFIRELSERPEPYPEDLVKKYLAAGVSDGDIAAALLARSALSSPEVPASAMAESERRIEELIRQAGSRPSRSGADAGLKGKVRKLFRKE